MIIDWAFVVALFILFLFFLVIVCAAMWWYSLRFMNMKVKK